MPLSPITARERVIQALRRQPSDRTPYHFRAEPEVYAALRARFDLPDDEAVRVWAGSDIRDIGAICGEGGYGGYTGFGWRDRPLADGTQEDFWGVRRRRVVYDGGAYTDICHWPLRNATPAEIRAYAWPDPARIFDFSTLPALLEAQYPGHAYWTLIEIESLFDRCWALRGMEGFMEDLLAEPELAEYMLTWMAEFFFTRTRMLLDAAHGAIDAVGLFNDLGTQQAMMISPALYRAHIKPRQRRLIEMAKEYGVTVFYHSCGAVEPIIDDFIEIGVDIIDPLQMPAMGVTPEVLHARYGGRITFHGGLDTQTLLPYATPDAVAAEARHLCTTLGADGGYILAGSHLYQVDIPLENIRAIQQT